MGRCNIKCRRPNSPIIAVIDFNSQRHRLNYRAKLGRNVGDRCRLGALCCCELRADERHTIGNQYDLTWLYRQHGARHHCACTLCDRRPVQCPQRSGRACAVIYNNRHGFGHILRHSFNGFRSICDGSSNSVPRRGCCNYEYPDSWLGGRSYCRPHSRGSILLEHFGQIPRRAKRNVGRFQSDVHRH